MTLFLEINLNRILHATSEDAAKRIPKVEVLRRAIERLGLGCRVEAIQANVLADDVLMRLRDADLIFGCVDKAYPRKLLSQFSYRYFRPFIDVGSEIGGDQQGIVSLDGRTNYVAPGRPCLLCTGLVTPRELAFESLSYAERERVIALGYSRDLTIEKPAVMDLNMRAASYGMMVLRHAPAVPPHATPCDDRRKSCDLYPQATHQTEGREHHMSDLPAQSALRLRRQF
jgi:ThiF family